ncbi:hypothetical protein EB077_09300 [bacterium]|nr:hypothetical protein [bacterium]
MTKYIHTLYPKTPEYTIEREARANGTTRIYQVPVKGKERRRLLSTTQKAEAASLFISKVRQWHNNCTPQSFFFALRRAYSPANTGT